MSFVDDFERTWTFSELVRALASSPPIPGMTPVSRAQDAGIDDSRACATADVISAMLASMNARQNSKNKRMDKRAALGNGREQENS